LRVGICHDLPFQLASIACLFHAYAFVSSWLSAGLVEGREPGSCALCRCLTSQSRLLEVHHELYSSSAM
jgi:hypothetical protein